MSVDSTVTPSGADAADGKSTAPDGNNKQTTKDEYVSRAELKEVIDARDKVKARLREAEEARKAVEEKHSADVESYRTQLRELEELKRKQADDEAVKRLDLEALRKSAKEREEQLEREAREREQKLLEKLQGKETELSEVKNKWLLEAEVLRTLGEVTIDPQAAMLLIRDKLELGADESGRPLPRIKDSVLTVKDFVEKHFEETSRSYLLKNPRKPGTGAPQQQEGSSSQAEKALSMQEILALPDGGAGYFAKNPEAARKFAEGFKLRK